MKTRTGTDGRRTILEIACPAKLNLHLEVLRKREDGYHEIETVLQAIDLFDVLRIESRPQAPDAEPRFDIDVDPVGSAPESADNLCIRAAKRFCDRTRRGGHFVFRLRKRIPTKAGMGGGSSNAAAVLVGLDRLLGTRLEQDELEAMGAEIGADVPFFIRGGTQLGRGIGTDLKRLAGLRNGCFLVVKPPIALSTTDVYQYLNMGLTTRSPKVNIRRVEALLARFPEGSWFGNNRLEEVVVPSHPDLQRTLVHLQEKASFAMMTGSGAAIFAICGNRREGEELARDFDRPDWFVEIVRPYGHGVTIKDD